MKQNTPKAGNTDKVLSFKIIEDVDNIYILDYTIPKANEAVI